MASTKKKLIWGIILVSVPFPLWLVSIVSTFVVTLLFESWSVTTSNIERLDGIYAIVSTILSSLQLIGLLGTIFGIPIGIILLVKANKAKEKPEAKK